MRVRYLPSFPCLFPVFLTFTLYLFLLPLHFSCLSICISPLVHSWFFPMLSPLPFPRSSHGLACGTF